MPEVGQPSPPREAQLIRRVRESLAISPEVAASRVEVRLSGSRWRQIEAGYRKDIDKPVKAKPPLLAQMARALDIAPERLEEVGCHDAADLLREILRREAPTSSQDAGAAYANLSDRHERVIWELDLPEDMRRNLIDALRRGNEERRQAG